MTTPSCTALINWLHQYLELGTLPTEQQLVAERVRYVQMQQEDLFEQWYQETFYLRALEPLPANSGDWQEIQYHQNYLVFICAGIKKLLPLNMPMNTLEQGLKVLALKQGLFWNYQKPFISFSCELWGSRCRLSLQHACLSSRNRVKAFLRRIGAGETLTLNHFIPTSLPIKTQQAVLNKRLASHSHEMMLHPSIGGKLDSQPPLNIFELLTSGVKQGKNILIAGATGSGKTTFLNTLARQIEIQEHILVIEDCAEIQLCPEQLATYWLGISDIETGQDRPQQSLKTLCSYALRCSPDRLLLGEIRSSEIVPLWLLLNTGHQGLLTTVHANSALDAVHRLALLFSMYHSSQNYDQALKSIAKQIDWVVFLKNRQLTQVIDCKGADQGQCYAEILWELN